MTSQTPLSQNENVERWAVVQEEIVSGLTPTRATATPMLRLICSEADVAFASMSRPVSLLDWPLPEAEARVTNVEGILILGDQPSCASLQSGREH